MEGVRVTVHFHGGTTAVTTLTDEDVLDVCQELRHAGIKGDAKTIEDCIEAVFNQSGKPKFQWLGDIYLHPQAVTGVELLDIGGTE